MCNDYKKNKETHQALSLCKNSIKLNISLNAIEPNNDCN